MQQTNDRLLQILSDTVKTNLVAEERISRRLAGLVSEGNRLSTASSNRESGLGTGDSSDVASRGEAFQINQSFTGIIGHIWTEVMKTDVCVMVKIM